MIAAGTPASLITEHFERTALEFLTDDRLAASELQNLPGAEYAEETSGLTKVFSSHVTRTTSALMELCTQKKIDLRGLKIHTATLEDVFLKLTGRTIRE